MEREEHATREGTRVQGVETGRCMVVSVSGHYTWNRAWWEARLGSGQWSLMKVLYDLLQHGTWRGGTNLEVGGPGRRLMLLQQLMRTKSNLGVRRRYIFRGYL